MPQQVRCTRAQVGVLMEMKGLPVELGKQTFVGRRFREAAIGDFDDKIITIGDGGPQAFIEHPVGVWREGEAIAGIVIATLGMLMDVAGLDDVADGALQAVAGEGAGVLVE